MKPLTPDPLTVSTSRAVSCRAWLGYRAVCPLTVGACAWCPDLATVETWGRQKGVTISHGICADHQGEQLRLAGVPADQTTAEPPGSPAQYQHFPVVNADDRTTTL